MNTVVVTPAYQAGRLLPMTLARIGRAGVPGLMRIVVVDDGSRDDTADAARAAGASSPVPVQVIVRPMNGGYGAAMKDGLAAARMAGADVVACVHADGQYSPEVLPALLEARARGGLDLLQGSRIAGGQALEGGMPLYKYLGNAALNVFENAVLGLGLTDYHSGYLIYGPAALARLPFARLSDSFDFDLEVIAAARAQGLAVGEAPIPTHYGDEKSHLQPVTYGLRVLRVLWKYRTRRYAPD